MPQSEQILEQNLIAQLEELKYERVSIQDEDALISNLKRQLEKHNRTTLSELEFQQVLNKISKGNIFERAKILRDKIDYAKDNGETGYLELINQVYWCKNQYQVTNQIKMEGKYKNRYDVTILVNGLPLCQIELKRRGLEMKEAFNQTNRYQRHSFQAGKGLFQYIQLFVISNGVNTKYYANNPIKARNFKQTFFWADRANKKITQLSDFAKVFLEPCHLSKMITKYIVLNESQKILMVLRPYQYYAVEAIVEKVKTSKKFGYIWHTTGSGKTLTSFKTSQILTNLPEVKKVVFVVDRKDLDYQTIREFNHFSDGSIDGTNDTKSLVKQFNDDTKIIVTTIQKLNTAIHKDRYKKQMERFKNERMVFIFDECHRSQFGDTHQRIKDYFEDVQMFGFTGTPIFADNAVRNERGKRTTKELFGECLHKYVITDAIRDGNVLKFSIEYISTFKKKEEVLDIDVESIDKAEVMEAPERLEKVADYIISNHSRKTHSKRFTAIFCVPNVNTLIEYYKLFKAKKLNGDHDLKIGTIFSYQANEEDADAMGILETDPGDMQQAAEDPTDYETKHSKEHLEDFIQDYNEMFQRNYTTNDFYSYYKDIGKKVKNKELDILLVVNMFLTGFDSKTLNTIYVDKNLRYHGLIQAYSRTNRILNELKSQGNVVAFRNLKKATDEAITLFSNKDAIEDIILQPYEDYVTKFDEAIKRLLKIAPTVDSVNELPSENEEFEFVTAFRELLRIKNVLNTFTEFEFKDLGIDEQTFEDYKSKYLDIRDKVRNDNSKEKVSILDDIDFEVELIHRDEVNVVYILTLLADLKDAKPHDQAKKKKQIEDLMASETQLRSKKELIERFIAENLPLITERENIPDEFENFWTVEKMKALEALSIDENLDQEKLNKLIADYLFTEKQPLRDEVIETMKEKPGLRERKKSSERIIDKIKGFIETFINGMG